MPDTPNISARQMSHPAFIESGIEGSDRFLSLVIAFNTLRDWIATFPQQILPDAFLIQTTFHPLQTSSGALCIVCFSMAGALHSPSEKGKRRLEILPLRCVTSQCQSQFEVSGCLTSLLRHHKHPPVLAAYKVHA